MAAGSEDHRDARQAQLELRVSEGKNDAVRHVPELEQAAQKPGLLERLRRRRLVAGVLVAFLAVLMTPVLLIGSTVWRNNSDMASWREEIYAASEIEGVELVERGSRFGLQPMTNGNHCDREAWLVYRTDLSPAAIEARFDCVVKRLGFGSNEPVGIERTGV